MKKIAADRNYRMLKRAQALSPRDIEIEALRIALHQGWKMGSFNHYTNPDFSDLGTLDKKKLVEMYQEEAKKYLFQDKSTTVKGPIRR